MTRKTRVWVLFLFLLLAVDTNNGAKTGGCCFRTSFTPFSHLLRPTTSALRITHNRKTTRQRIVCLDNIDSRDDAGAGITRGDFLVATTVLTSAAVISSFLTPPSEPPSYDIMRERIFDTRKSSFLPADPERLINPRFDARFICLGEMHSHPLHHRMQFNILKATHKLTRSHGESLAIGLEMFYRQHQVALDRYVYYHGDLGVLKEETDWDQTWGFDFHQYAKILHYARENGIRLVGLNAPVDLVHLVNQVGIRGLPKEIRVLLPDMDLEQEAHRKRFEEAIGAYPHAKDMSSDAMSRMYEAQTLWDEFMADSATRYLSKAGGRLLILAGNGHIQARNGIPDRVKRRTGLTPFTVVPVNVEWTQEGLPDIDHPPGPAFADWVYFTQAEIV